MINIHKLREPNSLLFHRQQIESDYSNIPAITKKELREQLLREQGYICCYCMARISATNSKIEHWESQEYYPERQLDYTNLLLTCNGNEGLPEKQQHCDTSKGCNSIKYSPADRRHDIESILRYNGKGKISSIDSEFNEQINTVLNLNFIRLRKNREAVIDGVKDSLNRYNGRAPKRNIQRQLDRFKTANAEGKFREYAGIAIYYLKKRIERR